MLKFLLFVGLLCSPSAALAQLGRVHPDPDEAYPGFKPHEISFELPKDGVARDEFRSEPFYAVILQSSPRCSVGEGERQKAQVLFPDHKVFVNRFGCEGEGDPENINYTNVNPQYGFMAVYAGKTQAEAKQLLKKINGLNLFPGANIRKIRAVLVYP